MFRLLNYFLSVLFLVLGTFVSNVKAFQVPVLNGPVMDEVGLLRPQLQRQLASDLFDFKQKTGVQIQVYITKSLQEEPIENVAIQIFDQWKLGSEKKMMEFYFLLRPMSAD